ncbi:MAG: ABC transporter permease [Acidimicrobiia bacterium]|nr:ABC transporter permease [Acidimicrobiia bacterium]
MDVLRGVIDFFATWENWVGDAGILQRTGEHIGLSVLALVVAGVLAIPIAVWLGHVGKGGVVAVSVVNIGRAVPSFAIVALALPITIRMGLGLGFWPTFIALVALALPPMFTNAYTGVREVDAGLREAALGMGMTPREVLVGVELPLASPVIMAAIRVTAVQVVATATLGALVAWGGLGRYIIDGFSQRDFVELVVGAILVAVLSILTDAGFGVLERVVAPRGLPRPASVA